MARLSKREKSYLFLFFIVNISFTIFLFLIISKFMFNVHIEEKGSILSTFSTVEILAYTFGLRHAVDADHLAAIDNTTRKLIQEGKRPLFVGTFFSLGHSTVVLLMSIALIVTTRYVINSLNIFIKVGNLIGTLISGSFLYLIAFMNLIILINIVDLFNKFRKEKNIDQHRLNELLIKRGFMNRYFSKLFKLITKQWQMYIIGFLFGLGFDTATEIAILAISATLATTYIKLPMYIFLTLPLLFTLGMSLIDTLDGIFMSIAYNWALTSPLSKLWYNITMTLISITIAFGIGTIELLGLIQGEFNLKGVFWTFVASLNNMYWETLGFYIIGTFAVTWLVSIVIYKYRIRGTFKK